MKAITFSLQTQQPLLATSFQGDPNSDVSYSYIPGSMIRGALIGRYMRQERLGQLDLNDSLVQQLFFDVNQIRYLNAYLEYLEDRVKQRSLPVPRSWFRDKNAELLSDQLMPIYDRAHLNCELPDPEDFEPKKVTQEFCTVKRNTVVLHSVTRRRNIHNRRDRRKGRSIQIRRNEQTNEQQGEGVIFRYDAIDSGQMFQAVILCQSDETASIVCQLLEKSPDLWIGGSQSAGYGHVKISNILPHDSWNEVGVPVNKRINHNHLTITLLSDALLINEVGQSTADIKLIKIEIEALLGISLPNPKSEGIFATDTLIGGFNRKWGLPLPQVPAVFRGSVITFEGKGCELDAAQIQQLEMQGIGERRIDGFGQIVVNWLDQPVLNAKLPDPSSSVQPRLETELSRTVAKRMAKQLLQRKLEKHLKDRVSHLSILEGITNSQLSRLQIVARQALSIGDCDSVLSLLNNLPSNASRQFENTKINGLSLKSTLKDWLSDPSRFVKDWFSSPDTELTLIVGDESAQQTLTEELAKEYTLRLIIALAKKTMKE